MQIAWGTLVVSVLLLPGFVFVFRLYAQDRISTGTAGYGSPEIATFIILISFILHSLFFIIINKLIHYKVWIDFSSLASILFLDKSNVFISNGLIYQFNTYGHYIFIYFIVICCCSFLCGQLLGNLITQGKAGKLIKHAWVYDIIRGNRQYPIRITPVFVLTNIQHQQYVLGYSGILYDLFLKKEGTIAYIQIRAWNRFYLVLEKDCALMKGLHNYNSTGLIDFDEKIDFAPEEGSSLGILMIEGEDIANVVFHDSAMVSFE